MNADRPPREIGDYLDDDGRPLAERAAASAAGMRFDVRACPYRDARYGRQMNVDAMRQIQRQWPACLAAIRQLRGDMQHAFGPLGDPMTELARLTRIMSTLPEFLVQFLGCGNGRIPAIVSVLFKLSRGLVALNHKLLFDASAQAGPPDPLTPLTLYGRIQETGILVGRSEVCAGPEKMILAVLSTLLGREADTVPVSASAGLDPVLTDAERAAAVRYGVVVADFLSVRAYFSAVYATLRRSVERRDIPRDVLVDALAEVETRPFLDRAPLNPPRLGQILATARDTAARIRRERGHSPADLLLDLDRSWEKARLVPSEVAETLASELGVNLRLRSHVNDIRDRQVFRTWLDQQSVPAR